MTLIIVSVIWVVTGNRSRAVDDKEKSTMVGRVVEGGGSTEGRTFNHAGHYNPCHERCRAYGGYARGWQRRPYRGYRYSGSQFNGSVGRGGGNQVAGQSASHGIGSHAVSQHQATVGIENPCREISATKTHEEAKAQKAVGKQNEWNSRKTH
jgi:hypothetical protein